MKLRISLIIQLAFAFLYTREIYAQDCPKVGRYHDRNCDGEIRIVFTGDSLVFGIGDSANKNKGGYVLRVGKKLKGVIVDNLGVPGIASDELLALIEAGFSDSPTKKEKAFADAILKADVVVIDLGRNDYFREDRERTIEETFGYLRDINSYIKKAVSDNDAVAPYVVQAVLMQPNRTDQGIYIKALNSLIFRSNSSNFPADLRFDSVSKRLLSSDQIHPTPKGYDAIARVFVQYFDKKIAPKL